jgi:hypothetical protein
MISSFSAAGISRAVLLNPNHAFFSSMSSATTSFNALASRRRSFTSSEVAALVSPANRFLPASKNSFDHR